MNSPAQESYRSWDEVIKRLPKWITELNYEGEWNMELYQVPSLDVKIRTIWEYYEVPRYGKKIATFSYMDFKSGPAQFYVDRSIMHLSDTFDGDDYSKTILLRWINSSVD
ncbi:MAG: hypothetical protein RIC30_15150 [Marinoscillum sp.]|uniref:hypothetical protein n=1 Tax=Marinoscillum sp. TaxID=2024838 RepID=UPI0032FEA6B9